jgi:hypothetical protein
MLRRLVSRNCADADCLWAIEAGGGGFEARRAPQHLVAEGMGRCINGRFREKSAYLPITSLRNARLLPLPVRSELSRNAIEKTTPPAWYRFGGVGLFRGLEAQHGMPCEQSSPNVGIQPTESSELQAGQVRVHEAPLVVSGDSRRPKLPGADTSVSPFGPAQSGISRDGQSRPSQAYRI